MAALQVQAPKWWKKTDIFIIPYANMWYNDNNVYHFLRHFNNKVFYTEVNHSVDIAILHILQMSVCRTIKEINNDDELTDSVLFSMNSSSVIQGFHKDLMIVNNCSMLS